MRTTLDLDDRLFQALMARYPGETKTSVVERAIREHLAQDAARRLRELRGKIEIEDLSCGLRRDRGA